MAVYFLLCPKSAVECCHQFDQSMDVFQDCWNLLEFSSLGMTARCHIFADVAKAIALKVVSTQYGLF